MVREWIGPLSVHEEWFQLFKSPQYREIMQISMQKYLLI